MTQRSYMSCTHTAYTSQTSGDISFVFGLINNSLALWTSFSELQSSVPVESQARPSLSGLSCFSADPLHKALLLILGVSLCLSACLSVSLFNLYLHHRCFMVSPQVSGPRLLQRKFVMNAQHWHLVLQVGRVRQSENLRVTRKIDSLRGYIETDPSSDCLSVALC